MSPIRVAALALLAALTLGAGPAPSDAPPPGPAAVTPVIDLRPVRLVYQQVEGAYLKGPRGVFVDPKRGDVYVADTMNDLVAVFDKNGLPLFAFGYNGELKEPIKAVTDDQGHIYVLTGRAVKVFNYRGEYLHDFRFLGVDRRPVPTALAAAKGEIYIADSASGQILVYDLEERLKRTFGDGGRIKSVAAITIDREGTVYVVDASSATAVQVYGADGRFLRGWGEHQMGPMNFSLPSGIAVDGEGRVVTVDMLRQQISVFTAEGAFQNRFGGLGTWAGAVSYPSDVASDGNGRVYVVERQGNRLQIFEERTTRAVTPRQAVSTPVPDAVREQLRRALGDMLKGGQ